VRGFAASLATSVNRKTAARTVKAAIDKHSGTIDVLVNNAGTFYTKSFTDFTVASDLTLCRRSAAVPLRFPRDVLPEGNGRNRDCAR
jgi:short-subunit dehydrogenase